MFYERLGMNRDEVRFLKRPESEVKMYEDMNRAAN